MPLTKYNVPIDLLLHVILKFVSYFDLDNILPYFKLTPKEIATIKFKIYKQRLTITKLSYKTEYYIEGKRHREGDLPAEEYDSGHKEWYRHGKLHRENGPAIIWTTGSKAWYYNGLRHRENDLPAIEESHVKHWYYNGLQHRENGLPAVVYEWGHREWYVNGVHICTKLAHQ